MITDKIVLAIDFDGTIVGQKYPEIGPLFKGAKEAINYFYDDGKFIIIIWSTRSGLAEIEMKEFLDKNGIKYHYINENCDEFKAVLHEPEGKKIYYDILVDDRAIDEYGIEYNDDWNLIWHLIGDKARLIEIAYNKSKEDGK